VSAVDRWDERPAAREEEGTPMAVLMVAQAEDLAVRIVAAIDALDADERRYADVRHYWHYAADRERVASDLAGLRHCERFDEVASHRDHARRYADGLLRTADLYGVQP
jgi:Ni,Fe-hydrogenase III component G